MFAKIAKYGGKYGHFGRRHGALSAALRVPCNDNQPARRRPAGLRPLRRPALVCGWRRVPATGRLECFWRVEPTDAAATAEPGISSLSGPRSWAALHRWIVPERQGGAAAASAVWRRAM